MKKLFLFLFISTILISCKSESIVEPDVNEEVECIRTALQFSLREHGIPGGVIAIIDGDSEKYIAEGYANIENLTPMGEDMKFRMASNSKTFTGRLVLMLVEEGLLNLEDKLIDHLPTCGIQYADTITVAQLLNHTSGIGNYNGHPDFDVPWFDNPTYNWSHDEILDLIKKRDPYFYPGTPDAWLYSDSNFFLLGLIVEKVTERSIEELIDERLISELNLSNTSFPTDSDMPDGSSTGYRFNKAENSLEEIVQLSPTAPWCAGAMITNVKDLSVWVKALGDGTFLTDEMQAKCYDFFPFRPGSNAGYGLGLMEVSGLRGHTGMIQGFESCMLYSPINDVSVVVWVNRCNEDQGIQPATSLALSTFMTLYPEIFN